MKSVGDAIRLAREQRGLSRLELSQLAGVSVRVVGVWETGACHPGADKLGALADALCARLCVTSSGWRFTLKKTGKKFR